MLCGLLSAAPEVRTAPLDLETAIELALENNERPAVARAQAAQARASYAEAWSRLLPSISVSGTYRRRAFEVVREFDGTRATFQASNALASEGRFDMRILDAAAIPDIQAAALRSDAADAQAEDVTRRLAFDTAVAYYAALAFDNTEASAKQRVELAAATSSNAQSRFAAGLIARGEVNRTKLDLLEARVTYAEAVRARRQARIALGFLIGGEPRGTLEIPTPPPPIADPREHVRPDVEAARFFAAAAERAALAPWLTLVPAIDLAASLRATNEAGFQDTPFNWDIALTLSWTLYDGGLRYAQADLRAAEATAARLALETLVRSADTELASASTTLDATLAIVAAAERRARLADENRGETAARFGQGLATALEVTDAATAAFSAELGLGQARLDVAIAALALRLAAGAWPTASAPSASP